ncbi:hypothetical protein [Sphingobium sp. CR28]|uniref:hypothetical protein n=1 Tax=Sphingobium sp. CR28 TaxID=3400272 RepID=UPI003FEE4AAF
MSPIERAALAFRKQLSPSLLSDGSLPVEEKFTEADFAEIARAAIAAIRDPDEKMQEAGAEVVKYVGSSESREAHRSDAANTFRFMIDALLSDG